MSKHVPCFEFEKQVNDSKTCYTFLPGNVSDDVFRNTVNAIYSAYENHFGQSVKNIMIPTQTEDGEKTFNVIERALPNVVQGLFVLYKNYNVKVFTKPNSHLDNDSVTITSYLDAANLTKSLDYYNKNNNDITTNRTNR